MFIRPSFKIMTQWLRLFENNLVGPFQEWTNIWRWSLQQLIGCCWSVFFFFPLSAYWAITPLAGPANMTQQLQRLLYTSSRWTIVMGIYLSNGGTNYINYIHLNKANRSLQSQRFILLILYHTLAGDFNNLIEISIITVSNEHFYIEKIFINLDFSCTLW